MVFPLVNNASKIIHMGQSGTYKWLSQTEGFSMSSVFPQIWGMYIKAPRLSVRSVAAPRLRQHWGRETRRDKRQRIGKVAWNSALWALRSQDIHEVTRTAVAYRDPHRTGASQYSVIEGGWLMRPHSGELMAVESCWWRGSHCSQCCGQWWATHAPGDSVTRMPMWVALFKLSGS